jgi:hypothetical protein
LVDDEMANLHIDSEHPQPADGCKEVIMARISRREMIAAVGTAPLVAAAVAAADVPDQVVVRKAARQDGQPDQEREATTAQNVLVVAHPLQTEKFNKLANDSRTRTEYLKSVTEVTRYLAKDAYARAAFLESADASLLTMLYNANRKTLEPVLGKLDGRTLEGRLSKIVHGAELFVGASGTDRSHYHTFEGEDAVMVMSSDSSSSSSGGSCSGCDVGGTLLGCCIIHFWGWTSGGCC